MWRSDDNFRSLVVFLLPCLNQWWNSVISIATRDFAYWTNLPPLLVSFPPSLIFSPSPCLQPFSFLSFRLFSYFPWQSLVPFMWRGSLLAPVPPRILPEVSEVPVEWDKGFSHSLLPGFPMRHQSAGKALWLRVLLGAICALSSGQIPSVQLLPRSRGTIG